MQCNGSAVASEVQWKCSRTEREVRVMIRWTGRGRGGKSHYGDRARTELGGTDRGVQGGVFRHGNRMSQPAYWFSPKNTELD